MHTGSNGGFSHKGREKLKDSMCIPQKGGKTFLGSDKQSEYNVINLQRIEYETLARWF